MNLVERIIRRAQRTPYFHLAGYMHRWWLVPKATPGQAGCGPVSAWKRPFSRLLQKATVSARVHELLRSDLERHLHDHPQASISIILRTGYEEIVPLDQAQHPSLDRTRCRLIVRRPGDIVYRPANYRHRIVLPEGETAWTIFIMLGPKTEWGFHTEAGWVHHAQYESAAWQAKLEAAHGITGKSEEGGV